MKVIRIIFGVIFAISGIFALAIPYTALILVIHSLYNFNNTEISGIAFNILISLAYISYASIPSVFFIYGAIWLLGSTKVKTFFNPTLFRINK